MSPYSIPTRGGHALCNVKLPRGGAIKWCPSSNRTSLASHRRTKLIPYSIDGPSRLAALVHHTDREPVGDRFKPDALRFGTAACASALHIDMANRFMPTAESYFGRVNHAQILAAIDEENGSHAPSLEKLKKSEHAVRAEQILASNY